MGDDQVLTARDLERLTPDERHRVVNDGILTDLGVLPPEFLARVRAKGRALLETRGLIAPTGDGG